MGILDNLENAWDGKLFLESNPMPATDNMGRETFWEDIGRPSDDGDNEQQLTSEQSQAILLFQIEQRLRQHIANQVELKFHGSYHEAAHKIAQFIKNMV